MTRLAIATVVVGLASALTTAYAGDGAACCACVVAAVHAQTSQAAPPPAPALFCAAASFENTSALAERCVMLDPLAKLRCQADTTNGTCITQLAESSIACPTSPAPTLSPFNLGALAVGLGLLGAGLLRRQRL